jgi:hypothetical protein
MSAVEARQRGGADQAGDPVQAGRIRVMKSAISRWNG